MNSDAHRRRRRRTPLPRGHARADIVSHETANRIAVAMRDDTGPIVAADVELADTLEGSVFGSLTAASEFFARAASDGRQAEWAGRSMAFGSTPKSGGWNPRTRRRSPSSSSTSCPHEWRGRDRGA